MNIQRVYLRYVIDAPKKYRFVVYKGTKALKRGSTDDADYEWQVKGLAYGIPDWDRVVVIDPATKKEIRSVSKSGGNSGSFAVAGRRPEAKGPSLPNGSVPSRSNIEIVKARKEALVRAIGAVENLRKGDPRIKQILAKSKNDYEALMRWKDRIEPMFKMANNPLEPRKDWNGFKNQMTDIYREIQRLAKAKGV